MLLLSKIQNKLYTQQWGTPFLLSRLQIKTCTLYKDRETEIPRDEKRRVDDLKKKGTVK